MSELLKNVGINFSFLPPTRSDLTPILKDLLEQKDLELVLMDLLNGLTRHDELTCVAIICDPIYLNVFEGALFKSTMSVPFVMVSFLHTRTFILGVSVSNISRV